MPSALPPINSYWKPKGAPLASTRRVVRHRGTQVALRALWPRDGWIWVDAAELEREWEPCGQLEGVSA